MTTKTAKQQLSFQLDFMALMLVVGRTDEAAQAAAKFMALIEALPDDLFINTKETTIERGLVAAT